MTVQSKNNNLNYLIDPTFTNVNGLFVLPFARTVSGDQRDSFLHYYLPNVEIKYFNVLIDRKSFFDLPVKNEEDAYEKKKTRKRLWSNNVFCHRKIRRNYFQNLTKFCHNHINNGNTKDFKFVKCF